MTPASLHLAADIGGTFTDFVVYDEKSGNLSTFKVFTTYPDRSEGLLEGVRRALTEHGATYSDIASFSHGSTIATNVLVEMRGARCGLITTAGFRDLLELRRQKRPHLYDLQADKPEPLIPRRLRLEVVERMLFDGSVRVPLNEDQVAAAAAELVEAGVEAVAIVFLNSYANPAHELRAKEIVEAAYPQLSVYISAEVMPEFREFERLSTTAVNAFVGPPIRTYLTRLTSELRRAGWDGTPLVMKGDGGIAVPEEAVRLAVTTIGSGPAGGVKGAALAASNLSEPRDLITFDMGGTSTDISLVLGGRASVTDSRTVAGWPIRGVATDIESIGAGGGSVAWIDGGGLLRVGPRSVGSVPGPASYGRGGTLPTITDANVVLGRLETLLGGEYALRADLAEAAIREHIAIPLDLSVEAAAEGILAVATAQMEQAIRLMTVERGHDPRDFTLVTFGGAGALHGPQVAQQLGIPRVIIPPDAGVLSAYGVLASDLTKGFSLTRPTVLAQESLDEIRAGFLELIARAEAWASSTLGVEAPSIDLVVEARCVGQNYELPVPIVSSSVLEPDSADLIAEVAQGFHAAHERAYGYAFHGAALECVTFRATAVVPGPVERIETVSTERDVAPMVRKRVVRWRQGAAGEPTKVVNGLRAGERLEGPALIESANAVITVWPGQVARGSSTGAVMIEELPLTQLPDASEAAAGGREVKR